MQNKKSQSIQEWFSFDMIKEKGIIRLKNKDYIKIIKVIPINYNLKSDLEKQAILNSYKTFLKTCNFDIQILIKSNKEDLSKHISRIQEKVKRNNMNLLKISEKYINFINSLNNEKNSSSKNFYIIIKNDQKDNTEELKEMELNERYFKIKECLARCGNNVIEIEGKEELIEIINSFYNTRKSLMK